MPPASTPLVAAALGGALATTAYLDAKLHISKDLGTLGRVKRSERNLVNAIQNCKASGFFLFEKEVQRLGNEQCIWSRQGEYTWAQTYEHVCQYGHFFQQLGVQPRQYVGVYMYNSPHFVFLWFGLLSIGAAPALINYNLACDALIHCIKVSGTKLLLSDSAEDCVSRIRASEEKLRSLGVKNVVLDAALKHDIAQLPVVRPDTDCFNDPSLVLPFGLFFTSGTTGLPKAVSWSASKHYVAGSLKPRPFGQLPGPGGDKSYICIPMYHGTGGQSTINDLMNGISVALAPRFSLSSFWQDCIDSKATIFIYVGEIARYLLSAPPSPNDQKHRIRLVWGNGLSPELWQRLQDRFGISEIGEFYGSTEGLLSFHIHCKNDYGAGAIGHHGWILRRQNHNTIVPVRIDPDSGDIWKSPETGFAQRVPYDEGGEILVKLPSRKAWVGYHEADLATKKKVLENVFVHGDVYYRSGDALRRTDDGHWFFMDRLGDSYRWKGENVSTTQVTQAFGKHPGIAEANVYGVEIPSHNGRAGCAAIALISGDADTFDWANLAKSLRGELPPYAVPSFIRVRSGVGKMSTNNHKHSKVQLRTEGVEPRALGTKVAGGNDDNLLWLPAGSPKYVPFTQSDWDRLAQLRARI